MQRISPSWSPDGNSVSTEANCEMSDGTSVSAGPYGCFAASHDRTIGLDFGFPVPLNAFEMVGQNATQPNRTLNGRTRGFIDLEDARTLAIPPSAQTLFGGASTFADLLCDAVLEVRDGRQGVCFEAGFSMRQASRLGDVRDPPPPRNSD